jgi:hypothetical protein
MDNQAKSIIHETVAGLQPSASTSFDLLPPEGRAGFSWEASPTIKNEEDKFFQIAGELMERPMSTILIEL